MAAAGKGSSGREGVMFKVLVLNLDSGDYEERSPDRYETYAEAEEAEEASKRVSVQLRPDGDYISDNELFRIEEA